jgi:signal transduction histidine kinase
VDARPDARKATEERRVSPEKQAHRFERFWQGDRYDTRGVGLGLFHPQEPGGGPRRTQLGGEPPGAGSTFRFTLPVASSEAGTP